MDNNERIAEYVQNLFHLENMQADDETYAKGSLSSDNWGRGITIRWSIEPGHPGEKAVNLTYGGSNGGSTCGIGSWMTAKEASTDIVKFIGRILIDQADTIDPENWSRNVLSWPYNCNIAYVELIIESLQYNDNPIESSPDMWAINGMDNPNKPRDIQPTRDNLYDDDDSFYEDPEYWRDLDERLRADYAEEKGIDLNETTIDEDDFNAWVSRGAAEFSSVNRNQKSLYSFFK